MMMMKKMVVKKMMVKKMMVKKMMVLVITDMIFVTSSTSQQCCCKIILVQAKLRGSAISIVQPLWWARLPDAALPSIDYLE